MSSQTQSRQKTADRLTAMPRNLAARPEWKPVIAALEQRQEASFDGVWGSGCALLAAALRLDAPGPLLVITPGREEAAAVAADLPLFLGEEAAAEVYAAWHTPPGDEAARDETHGERLRVIKQMLSPTPPAIITASIDALLQPAPSAESVQANSRTIRSGQQIDVEELQRWLASRGLHSTTAVELPGEFSPRGGILDIFAPDWTQPVRIELFDDEIESIRTFDVVTQRSEAQIEEIEITVLPAEDDYGAHFISMLPEDAWVLLHEPTQCRDQAQQYLSRVAEPANYHSMNQVLQAAHPRAVATSGGLLEAGAEASCQLRFETVERISGDDIGLVRANLDTAAGESDVIITAHTAGEIERLKEILQSTRLAATGRLGFVEGHLSKGFRWRTEDVLLISGSELFHRGELRRTPRKRRGKAIDSFLELRDGDLVVHLAHGIGRYCGMKMFQNKDRQEEHLTIEFRGGSKVYVPAAKIDLVQKYIGGTKTRPQLATIGSKSWQKQKLAAEEAVKDLAADMLHLQAERAMRPGIAFAADNDWQAEFDGSFPYQETPDQATAIAAIKEDMQQPRPMDRLLCGDVGYGKTEVAMRAAFKAVTSGYQVAVLAPTTILVEQHFQTFTERMREFPFDIARLSRFSTPKQQRQDVAAIRKGQIDVVIGTHRLASKDVKFHNLGLLIIDEEQRFGVEVKERLKSLRSTVDVLTMSATPIPRTLHMSLVGVRDISNLETPPSERTAVETRVTRFDDQLIRRAVLRELSRGGQTFFVHNRVSDIHETARKVQDIVPEATICVGHGQMAEGELEKVMVDFIAGKYDILVATTIVESGLDIPNANTIFIDEADKYGLAELHQLRGRVGRYKHRAYAYLLIEPHKHLSPVAAKRLRAIEEFSEMGAGFAISMRDLEIRGAGNLLGVQQSGHIASVGYEYYCQLLENAVRRIKKQPAPPKLDVEIALLGDAYLPSSYVPAGRTKIDIYRRLTRLASYDEVESIRTELRDRFGPLPECAERMIAFAELRLDAAVWQIQAIYLEGDFIVLAYADRNRIEQLVKLRGAGKIRVVDSRKAYIKIKSAAKQPDVLIELLKSVLRP